MIAYINSAVLIVNGVRAGIMSTMFCNLSPGPGMRMVFQNQIEWMNTFLRTISYSQETFPGLPIL